MAAVTRTAFPASPDAQPRGLAGQDRTQLPLVTLQPRTPDGVDRFQFAIPPADQPRTPDGVGRFQFAIPPADQPRTPDGVDKRHYVPIGPAMITYNMRGRNLGGGAPVYTHWQVNTDADFAGVAAPTSPLTDIVVESSTDGS